MASKIFVLLLVALVARTVVTNSVCAGHKGPTLCHHDFLKKVVALCDNMARTKITEHQSLPRCCCSFGCEDGFLKKNLCPEQ